MSLKRIFFLFVVFLAFSLTAEGSQNIITLNYPPDKTVMEFDILSISLSIPKGSADLIKVNVNDEEKVKVTPSREIVCFSVPLAVGVNKIDIILIKKNKLLDNAVLSIFRRSDLVSAYKTPPAGFQKDYFHMKDHLQCAACHTLKPSESDRKSVNIITFAAENLTDGKKAVAAASTCYSCHKRITSYPYVHGPAFVWSCLSCHDPQTEPKYSVKKPDTKACFSCHLEEKESWNKKKYFHGPFNTGNCAICHNPHASENPFYLILPTWYLCLSCHVDKGSGKHIIEGYVYKEGHPTHGKPDPLRKGRELTCASCHSPHASDYPKLWTFDVGSGFDLCKKCHIKE